jgi:hypothetical protein
VATLEINGTLHVYDLSQRKILFFTKYAEEEISEGSIHQSRSRRLVRFSEDGELLGFFTQDNGFKLYHVQSESLLLDFKWRGPGVEAVQQSPQPFDLKFIGKYLLLQYNSDNENLANPYDNNSFLFDIKKGSMVNVLGIEGFKSLDDFLENADTAKQVSIYAKKPRKIFKVDIKWKGNPIKATLAFKRPGPILIDKSGIKSGLPPEEGIEEEEEPTSTSASVSALKEMNSEDSLLQKRLSAAIKQNNDWKTMFGSIEDFNQMYSTIDSLKFILSSVDQIDQYTLSKYEVEGYPYNIIEVSVKQQPLQYYMEQKLPGIFRFKNAYFINTVRKFATRRETSNYWQLLWPGENGMIELTSFPDQKGFDLKDCIIISPSGNKIAWGVNDDNSADIYGLNLVDGNLKKIHKIPARKIDGRWIRNDALGLGNFRQLNVYRFVDDDYFFIQGMGIMQNNMLFETIYWTKLLDQQLAGDQQTGSKAAPTKNLLSSRGKILIDNEKTWTYASNLFEPIAYKQTYENYDEDYENISVTEYKSLDRHFLKQIKLRYDSGKILLNDGSRFIETAYDQNNRIKWIQHNGSLRLEYYPHLSMLDMESVDVAGMKVSDPNYYSDVALSAHIRLTGGNGKEIILQSPFGASRAFFKADFSDDSAFVFSIAGHNFIDVWKAFDGTYLATIMPYGNSDFLIIDKDQYFYTTNPAALRNFYLQVNGKMYPAEELDIYQNRPDLILQSLSFIKNEQLLSFYKEWVQRRQQAAGTDQADPSQRPSVTLNTGTIPLASNRPHLPFNFSVTHNQKLSKAYLQINNILTDSISLAGLQMQATFTAHLQRGSNKIQVLVKDKNGLQSLKETFYINYEAGTSMSSRVAGVAMGVSKYENEKYNLQYAAKDAQDLSERINSFEKATIVQLLDDKATAKNLQAIGKQLGQLQPDDIVVVYLAGHGALDSKGHFYFCTPATDLSSPEMNGISMQELQSFFNQFRARRRLLILDACHSGNSNPFNMAQTTNDSSLTQPNQLKSRGNILINKSLKRVPNISSRNYAEILKQQLYDAGTTNGVQVFSATSGAGLAYESDKWKNGIFTMMLLKGLEKDASDYDRNKKIDLQELVSFVSELVLQSTRGLQSPECTLIKWDNNWVLIE